MTCVLDRIGSGRAGAVMLLLLLCAASLPVSAEGEKPLTFPYLDGSETAFPAFRAAAERVSRSYVSVTLIARPDPITRDQGGELHTGSGIILDREGHILTAAHIARGPQFEIRVQLREGRRITARLVRLSPDTDLALLKTEPLPGSVPVGLGDSIALKRGDPAMAIGSARRSWGVVSLGQVRAPRIRERLDYGAWGFSNAIEIAMEVESGHSGGPLVNIRGELIGMIAGYELGDTTKPAYRSPRIAYAVPVNDIKTWLAK